MEDIYSIINKVLNGNATEEEYLKCASWIEANQVNHDEFEAFQQLFSHSGIIDKNAPDFYEGLIRIQKAKQKKANVKVKRKRLTFLACLILAAVFVLYIADDLTGQTSSFQFKNAPIQVILSELEKSFEVEITVHDNTILHCPFTGTFHNNTINEILTSLSNGSGLTFKMTDEGHYQLKEKECR